MELANPTNITNLLIAWNAGDDLALEKLTPLVYAELRRLARRYIAAERPGHVLQASALVNEAYLRLIDAERVHWQNRAHFFGVSCRLMRQILVDYARRSRRLKRGGGVLRVTLDGQRAVGNSADPDELLAIDEALTLLSKENERAGRVVEMRFFGGLTQEETAEAVGVSEDTVLRDWTFGKAWLRRQLRRDKTP